MTPPTPPSAPRSPDSSGATLLAGAGEMRECIRELDWSLTPLGTIAGWPNALRTVVDVALGSAFPHVILWGPELIQLYNDAYRELIGEKHPAAVGQPTREFWPEEVWEINGPLFARVWTGETVFLQDARYLLERNGVQEDAYFTLS